LIVPEEGEEEGKKKKKNRKKNKAAGNVLTCLNEMVPYMSAPLGEHVMKELSISENELVDENSWEKLVEAANKCRDLVIGLER